MRRDESTETIFLWTKKKKDNNYRRIFRRFRRMFSFTLVIIIVYDFIVNAFHSLFFYWACSNRSVISIFAYIVANRKINNYILFYRQIIFTAFVLISRSTLMWCLHIFKTNNSKSRIKQTTIRAMVFFVPSRTVLFWIFDEFSPEAKYICTMNFHMYLKNGTLNII